MRDGFEELRCLLQSYDKKNAYKTALIAVVCALTVFAAVAAIIYFVRGFCFCGEDFCDFEDDFDDEDDDFEDDE